MRTLTNPISRVALLRRVSVFAAASDDTLAGLAAQLGEEHFGAGTQVFAEGDPGDRLLIVAEGQAEIAATERFGPVPLATAGPGEIVGELALLAVTGGRRAATVTALTPLTAYSLTAERLHALLTADSRLAAAFYQHAEELVTGRFIKTVGPFMTLDDTARRRLATRVKPRLLTAGQPIVRQGEPGDSCFLLRSGRAEVTVTG